MADGKDNILFLFFRRERQNDDLNQATIQHLQIRQMNQMVTTLRHLGSYKKNKIFYWWQWIIKVIKFSFFVRIRIVFVGVLANLPIGYIIRHQFSINYTVSKNNKTPRASKQQTKWKTNLPKIDKFRICMTEQEHASIWGF